MKDRQNKNGKRLRFVPLILGGYGAWLGFGLMMIGFAEIRQGIGMIRFLLGLGMAGFGLLGIWDGVRDLVRPEEKPEQLRVRQFILTDTSGNDSSNVTGEVLQEQLKSLMERDKGCVFKLRILPPFAVQEAGNVSQIFCIYHEVFRLTAFLDVSDGRFESYHKSAEFDEAKEWFEELLTGNADLSGWIKMENVPLWEEYNDEDGSGEKEDRPEDTDEPAEPTDGFGKSDSLINTEEAAEENGETDIRQTEERVKSYWYQLQREQRGQMRNWHQLLVIFGESWHDEHKFFSGRDVELAVEGIHEGKYTKVFLEWGIHTFDLFPGVQNDLAVIWCTNHTGRGNSRFLVREGTVTQVKFWMNRFLNEGFFEDLSGWEDITAQVKKEGRKGKHGKLF